MNTVMSLATTVPLADTWGMHDDIGTGWMIVMMADINKTNFGGRQVVTCYSCHRGSDRPKLTPDLSTIYTTPVEDPNDVIGQVTPASQRC